MVFKRDLSERLALMHILVFRVRAGLARVAGCGFLVSLDGRSCKGH